MVISCPAAGAVTASSSTTPGMHPTAAERLSHSWQCCGSLVPSTGNNTDFIVAASAPFLPPPVELHSSPLRQPPVA